MIIIDFETYELLATALRNGLFPKRALQVLHVGSFEPIKPWGSELHHMQLTEDLRGLTVEIPVYGMADGYIVSAWGVRMFDFDPVSGGSKDLPFDRGVRPLQNDDKLNITVEVSFDA